MGPVPFCFVFWSALATLDVHQGLRGTKINFLLGIAAQIH
jgi:hypothetical protein